MKHILLVYVKLYITKQKQLTTKNYNYENFK